MGLGLRILRRTSGVNFNSRKPGFVSGHDFSRAEKGCKS
jgi:hypothetical protein